jgi:hypothetical protein
MVAAGGGGANNRNIQPSGGPFGDGNGGAGGGLIGINGTSVNNSPNGWGFCIGTGSNQTVGGSNVCTAGTSLGASSSVNGLFGNTVLGQSGGGGGYYGGGSPGAHGGGGGGSSFISGHTGSVAIISATNQNPRTNSSGGACTTGINDNVCSRHYSGRVFTK